MKFFGKKEEVKTAPVAAPVVEKEVEKKPFVQVDGTRIGVNLSSEAMAREYLTSVNAKLIGAGFEPLKMLSEPMILPPQDDPEVIEYFKKQKAALASGMPKPMRPDIIRRLDENANQRYEGKEWLMVLPADPQQKAQYKAIVNSQLGIDLDLATNADIAAGRAENAAGLARIQEVEARVVRAEERILNGNELHVRAVNAAMEQAERLFNERMAEMEAKMAAIAEREAKVAAAEGRVEEMTAKAEALFVAAKRDREQAANDRAGARHQIGRMREGLERMGVILGEVEAKRRAIQGFVDRGERSLAEGVRRLDDKTGNLFGELMHRDSEMAEYLAALEAGEVLVQEGGIKGGPPGDGLDLPESVLGVDDMGRKRIPAATVVAIQNGEAEYYEAGRGDEDEGVVR